MSSVLRAALSAVTAPPRVTGAPPAEEASPPRPRYGPRGALPWYRRIDPWHAAPILVAIAIAIVYLLWQPRTVDLAAHTFRANLFGEEA